MQNFIDLDALIELRLLLRRTEETIQKARQKELRKYGITPAASAVWHLISDLGGSARLQELSHWLFRKQHTTQELLNRMEKAGLVQRVNEPDRKNGVRVALTEQGNALYKQTKQLRGPRKIFSSLNKEQCIQLQSFLHTLLHVAQKELGDENEVELRPSHVSKI